MIDCSHCQIPIDTTLHNLITKREAGVNGRQFYYHEDCYDEILGVSA